MVSYAEDYDPDAWAVFDVEAAAAEARWNGWMLWLRRRNGWMLWLRRNGWMLWLRRRTLCKIQA